MFIKLHSLLLEEINFGSRSESLGGIYKALSIISFYLEKHIKKTCFLFTPHCFQNEWEGLVVVKFLCFSNGSMSFKSLKNTMLVGLKNMTVKYWGFTFSK